MENEENKKIMLARIEEAIEFLCVPKEELEYTLLTYYDRLRLLKFLMVHIAGMDVREQSELTVYWLNTLANRFHEKEKAFELLRNLAKVLYAGPKMEKWAETRLINMNMEIDPMKMAYEYAAITNQDERMAGLYVRDMQRIKSRLYNRIARTGTPEKRKGRVVVQKPRYKRTARQEAKRKEQMAREEAWSS